MTKLTPIVFVLVLTAGLFMAKKSVDAHDTYTDTEYKVKVYYFYPTDYTPDERYIRAIDPFVKNIQDWYAYNLYGYTFSSDPVITYQGLKTADEYISNGPPWARIMEELGVVCGTGPSKIITLVFLARTVPHAGGRPCVIDNWYVGGTTNGDATVSESDLDAEIVATQTGFCPNGFPLGDWRCSPMAQRGGVAHELGHAFTLPHPPGCDIEYYDYCARTLMWSWWKWPNVRFLNRYDIPEKQTLLGSAWFWNKQS